MYVEFKVRNRIPNQKSKIFDQPPADKGLAKHKRFDTQ